MNLEEERNVSFLNTAWLVPRGNTTVIAATLNVSTHGSERATSASALIPKSNVMESVLMYVLLSLVVSI